MYVHEKALAAVDRVEAVARALERIRPSLADQLRRAVDSVVLNIAEGANEFSLKDKLRFYRIARRSAAEVDAALELAARFAPATDVDAARHANAQVMALLTRLMAGLDARR